METEIQPPSSAGYRVLRNVAIRRRRRGDLLGALDAYRYAAALAGERRHDGWRAIMLGEMGDLYQEEGVPDLARRLYVEAISCLGHLDNCDRARAGLLARMEAEGSSSSMARLLGAGRWSLEAASGGEVGLTNGQGGAARQPRSALAAGRATWGQTRFLPARVAAAGTSVLLLTARTGVADQKGPPADWDRPASLPQMSSEMETDTSLTLNGPESYSTARASLLPPEPGSAQEPAPVAPPAEDRDAPVSPVEPEGEGSPPLPQPDPQAAPPAGHTRTLGAAAVVTRPEIDGDLTEACWQHPAPATGFWVSETGHAPQDATEVWVAADETSLYVAFRCRDAQPVAIFAEQTKRDGRMGYDDRVTVQIDPYHNHRSLSEFSVNAIGTQADSMAGGRAQKIEWKGEWKAAAARATDGWTAEFAIPFGVLNYAPGARTIGVNFLRYQHRTQETSRWADVTPALRMEEMGHLTGLRLPARSAPPLSLMTYTTGGLNTANRTGQRRPFVAGTGLDLRYNVSNNLTGMASLYPDFSQVEDQVTGLAFSYNEKLLEDRRPFFQEGSGFFGRNRTFFHSARVPDFNAGAKLFGRLGSMQLGVLGVTAPGGRSDYVARAVRELGPRSSLSLTAVQSQQRLFSNQLLALQGNTRSEKGLTASLDLASTRTHGQDGDGSLMSLALGRETPYLQFGVNAARTGQFFFPADGYVAGDQLGTIAGSAYVSYQREHADRRVRTIAGNVGYSGRSTLSGLLQSRNLFLDLSVETRSQRQLTLSYNAGPYRPRAKKPGEWSKTVNQDQLMTASLYFNTRSSRGGYGVTYAWGKLGGGRYANLAPSFWWKPNSTTSLSYSYERAFSFGTTRQSVLNMSWDLDRRQSIGLRWVDYQGKGYWRVAFRRAVVRGIDVYAVFNREPDVRDRFVLKLVRSLR